MKPHLLSSSRPPAAFSGPAGTERWQLHETQYLSQQLAVDDEESCLLAQQQWPQLLAQLHQRPAQMPAYLVAPVPHTQLIVQVSGAMRLSVARNGTRRHYHAQPGEVYLTATNQQAYEMAWQSETAAPIETVHVYLHNELLRQTAAEAGYDPARVEIRDDSCVGDLLLQQLGLALAKGMRSGAHLEELYVDTVAQMLAAQLVYHHCTLKRPQVRHDDRLSAARLRLLDEYVRANLPDVTLHALASLACLSPYHFCRTFKKATGLSPNQYVTAQRMQRAKQLLRQGDLSVSQVARAVGYRSTGHFTSLFQRCTGQLPSTFE